MTMDEMEERVSALTGRRRRSVPTSRRNDGAGSSSQSRGDRRSSQQSRGGRSSSQRGRLSSQRHTQSSQEEESRREAASSMAPGPWGYGSNAQSGWGHWTPPSFVDGTGAMGLSSNQPSSSQQPPWTTGFNYFFGPASNDYPTSSNQPSSSRQPSSSEQLSPTPAFNYFFGPPNNDYPPPPPQ